MTAIAETFALSRTPGHHSIRPLLMVDAEFPEEDILKTDDLQELVAVFRATNGVTAAVEAKAARSKLPVRLWETLSAFANAAGGGAILLGIDEETVFDVEGVEAPAKISADLAAPCDQRSPLRPQIVIHTLEGRPL